jgi:hypothetical protein
MPTWGVMLNLSFCGEQRENSTINPVKSSLLIDIPAEMLMTFSTWTSTYPDIDSQRASDINFGQFGGLAPSSQVTRSKDSKIRREGYVRLVSSSIGYVHPCLLISMIQTQL